ncbi:hypothetical protein CIB84_009406, partial [Bambusicola thoracicus]
EDSSIKCRIRSWSHRIHDETEQLSGRRAGGIHTVVRVSGEGRGFCFVQQLVRRYWVALWHPKSWKSWDAAQIPWAARGHGPAIAFCCHHAPTCPGTMALDAPTRSHQISVLIAEASSS